MQCASACAVAIQMNGLGAMEIILRVTSFLGTYEEAVPLLKTCVMNRNNMENLIDEYRFDYLKELYQAFYEW